MHEVPLTGGPAAFPGAAAPLKQRLVAAAVAMSTIVLVLSLAANPDRLGLTRADEDPFLGPAGHLLMPGLLVAPLSSLPAAGGKLPALALRAGQPAPPAGRKAMQDFVSLAERIPTERVDRAARDRNLMQSDLDQRNVAVFLASRYRVSLAAMRDYVAHAREAARLLEIDPLLILAVMGVESNYDPSSANPSGARGLMQVMPSVHGAELAPFGGAQAVQQPRINIYVGGLVLKQCIALAGSLERGLRYYVGASDPDIDDQGYVRKVSGEWRALRQLLGAGTAPSAQAITGASP